MNPAIAAELDALRAQRNREADTVAQLNGIVAALRAELEQARADLDAARAQAREAGLE